MDDSDVEFDEEWEEVDHLAMHGGNDQLEQEPADQSHAPEHMSVVLEGEHWQTAEGLTGIMCRAPRKK